MSDYSPSVTGKKAGMAAGTVSFFGIVAIIISNKLHPFLSANGVEIDQSILIVGVTTTLQSGYIAISNWFKHRKKS